MPNTYSKPLTDYFDTLPNTERGRLQESKNTADYVHRKELERLDADERREETMRQNRERLREAKNAKKRETMNELKPNITGWVLDGIAAISTPAMKLSIKKAFEDDGRFTEIRARVARQQVVENDAMLQELFDQWMSFDEPETVEEIASGAILCRLLL